MGLCGAPFLLHFIVQISGFLFGILGVKNSLVQAKLLIVGTFVAVQFFPLLTPDGVILSQGLQTLTFLSQGFTLGFNDRIKTIHLTVEICNPLLDFSLLLNLGLPY